MDIKFRYLPDSPPVFDAAKIRARWAAAKADYLAGGSGPEVCERHGLRLRSFRHRAKQEGWRRTDQPEPAVVAPDPAPAAQNDPLVIPEAPQALSGAPLTASEMVDKAWAMLQAAVAAGRLIEARGWLRLYKELKLHVPFAEMEARRAEAEQAAAPDTPAEPPPDPAPEPDPTGDLVRLTTRLAAVAQQAEKAALQHDLALPLHCSSPPERNDAPSDDTPSTPSPSGSTGGFRHADRAELAPQPGAPLESSVRPGNDGRVEAGGQNLAPQSHCFSDSQCNPADDLARLVAGLKALTGKAERALTDEALALQLHCFSDAGRNAAGPGP